MLAASRNQPQMPKMIMTLVSSLDPQLPPGLLELLLWSVALRSRKGMCISGEAGVLSGVSMLAVQDGAAWR